MPHNDKGPRRGMSKEQKMLRAIKARRRIREYREMKDSILKKITKMRKN